MQIPKPFPVHDPTLYSPDPQPTFLTQAIAEPPPGTPQNHEIQQTKLHYFPFYIDFLDQDVTKQLIDDFGLVVISWWIILMVTLSKNGGVLVDDDNSYVMKQLFKSVHATTQKRKSTFRTFLNEAAELGLLLCETHPNCKRFSSEFILNCISKSEKVANRNRLIASNRQKDNK